MNNRINEDIAEALSQVSSSTILEFSLEISISSSHYFQIFVALPRIISNLPLFTQSELSVDIYSKYMLNNSSISINKTAESCLKLSLRDRMNKGKQMLL